ncbi:MAG: hypothetical protein AAF514_06340 [Verrucomicrobiota bacterium]
MRARALTTLSHPDPSEDLQRLARSEPRLAVLALVALLETHPAEALACLEELIQTGQEDPFIDVFFDTWTRRDPDAAMATAIRLGRGHAGVAGVLGETDPQRGLAFLRENEISHYQPYKALIRNWARNDLPAATMAAENQEDGGLAQRIIAEFLTTRSLTAALNWMEQRHRGIRPSLKHSIYTSWAENHPEKAVRFMKAALKKSPPPDLPWQHLLGSLGPHLTAGELAIALKETTYPDLALRDFSYALPPEKKSALIHEMIPLDSWDLSDDFDAEVVRMARQNPKEACDFALRGTAAEYQPYAVASGLRVWQKDDPSRALDYVIGLASDQPVLFAEVSKDFFLRADPTEAMPVIADLPATLRHKAQEGLVEQLAHRQTEEAASYVSGIAPEDITRTLTDALFRGLSEKSGGFNAIEKQIRENAFPDMARNLLFERLGESRASADLPATTEWVSSLEAGKHRDHAINGMVTKLAPRDREAAFHWASTIADEELQFSAQTDALAEFYHRDPELGRNRLEEADLNPDIKDRLREKMAGYQNP